MARRLFALEQYDRVAGEDADDAVDRLTTGTTLLTAAEVTEVIGEHGGPRPGTGNCGWENPETYHSITLSIGRAGTAVDGNLPTPDPILGTPEPGPDGIRFVRTGAAEFAVGDRYCELTVVTSVTDDRDRPTLVRLVGLVRTRL
ncbi:hypothetical protein AWW66_13830 [Micromonospora rosaria]|uniref:Uncharacterized protein n=1 Tax=Micromonospora rosaria TaxID=47874 RepID=A0A136PSD5_9ACTN|nr:hypothetical protein [Micromonospora rosaria]KXK61389.1 hypothetical protein AWW66_13830 [Micromonospora rosaria]